MGLRHDLRGAVYVEFLLVFMPVFLLFLAIVELGFVYAARLVVQHASTRAVRAAVVVLDDDPALYGGAPRGRVDLGGSAPQPSPLDAFMTGAGLGNGGTDAAGGARFRDIRTAASIPLLAVAPTATALEGGEDNIAVAIGDGDERAIEGAQRYNRLALAVTFPPAPGSSSTRTQFGADELVTVRVTYLFRCSVPLVSRIMCDGPTGVAAKLTASELGQIAPLALPGADGARYLILRGEASLRNQGAGYLYAGQTP